MHSVKYLCLGGDSWRVDDCTLQTLSVRLSHRMRKIKESLVILSANSLLINARDRDTSHKQPDTKQPSFFCD